MILACIHQTLWDAGDLTHIARSRLDYMQFRAPFIRLIIAITLTGCGSLHANPLIDQLIGTTTAYLEDQVADRKSTRLNSSHVRISYAVFCLKKKKKYISMTATKNQT